MSSASAIRSVCGTAVCVAGNDIDTDRIIPARYLRSVTFEGLGEYAFADDRQQSTHSFDDPRFSDAELLVVNKNFGCGSSREHAPQALKRWGIRAIIGESFAEIFIGNCTALGVPCVCAAAEDVQALMERVQREPRSQLRLDLERNQLSYAGRHIAVTMPEAIRRQLMDGLWDATAVLLEAKAEVEKVAASLPYVAGWPPIAEG